MGTLNLDQSMKRGVHESSDRENLIKEEGEEDVSEERSDEREQTLIEEEEEELEEIRRRLGWTGSASLDPDRLRLRDGLRDVGTNPRLPVISGSDCGLMKAS